MDVSKGVLQRAGKLFGTAMIGISAFGVMLEAKAWLLRSITRAQDVRGGRNHQGRVTTQDKKGTLDNLIPRAVAWVLVYSAVA